MGRGSSGISGGGSSKINPSQKQLEQDFNSVDAMWNMTPNERFSLATKYSTEKANEKQIIAWCKENEIAKKIDETIASQFPDLPEEEVYFRRYEGLRYYVFKNFQSMSPPFLEHVVDEIYDSLFEE
jgi:hypothetical protein